MAYVVSMTLSGQDAVFKKIIKKNLELKAILWKQHIKYSLLMGLVLAICFRWSHVLLIVLIWFK